MKECKHEYTRITWSGEAPLTRHCLDCEALIPWGPSNDSPPEVRMEIRAAEILEPEFDGEMYFVRWVPREMSASESAAFAAAYRAGLDRSGDRFAGILEGGMSRHGQAGWLAWEIKSDVREDDHRREYAAAAAVRHAELLPEYEHFRDAEPDCRDEDDDDTERRITAAALDLMLERLHHDRAAKFRDEVDPATKFGELARQVTIPVVRTSLADLADGPTGDPDWQAKVWARIDSGTCAIDGCNEPIAEDALCAGHQPGAVQAGMEAAVTPHPDTLSAPPRSWPPNTGCDPEDVRCAVLGCRARCPAEHLDEDGWLRTGSGPLCPECRPL